MSFQRFLLAYALVLIKIVFLLPMNVSHNEPTSLFCTDDTGWQLPGNLWVRRLAL